jgi:hypothetical protein
VGHGDAEENTKARPHTVRVMCGRTYRRRRDARRAAECAERAQEEATTSG